MFRHRNVEENNNIRIANEIIENIAKFTSSLFEKDRIKSKL
jgi:hypothetical protein